MVGVKLRNLASILQGGGYELSRNERAEIGWNDIQKSEYASQVQLVYQELGGIGQLTNIVVLPFDLDYDSFVVELDEEIDFNRYRATTLRSSIYDQEKGFSLENYKSFCRIHERECLKSASVVKEWSDPASISEFGKAGDRGELHKEGSPKWKLRAFNQFLKDVAARIHGVKIIRISIWDNIVVNGQVYKVKDILISSNRELKGIILKNISRRLSDVI